MKNRLTYQTIPGRKEYSMNTNVKAMIDAFNALTKDQQQMVLPFFERMDKGEDPNIVLEDFRSFVYDYKRMKSADC